MINLRQSVKFGVSDTYYGGRHCSITIKSHFSEDVAFVLSGFPVTTGQSKNDFIMQPGVYASPSDASD